MALYKDNISFFVRRIHVRLCVFLIIIFLVSSMVPNTWLQFVVHGGHFFFRPCFFRRALVCVSLFGAVAF